MAYLNGALPATILGTIPGTFKQVLAQLAPQTDALRVAFAAEFGKPLLITDAYRNLDTQRELKVSLGTYAATPGTSVHGWGRAIDFGSGVEVDGSPEHRWMLAHAPAYGWTHPAWAIDWNAANGAHEPWHWEASATAVNYPRPPITPPPPPPPLPPIVQEDDMLSLILWCYREIVGREPAVDEVQSWITSVDGKTPAQVLNAFLDAQAEPASVVKAYRDYLARDTDPAPSEVAAWDKPGVTIRAVREGVYNSPEARKRRGLA